MSMNAKNRPFARLDFRRSLVSGLPSPRRSASSFPEQRLVIEPGPLQDPVTWYGINYAGTQITQWDFQNKGTLSGPARLSFVLEVPLRPSVIYSVPCDQILQRAHW